MSGDGNGLTVNQRVGARVRAARAAAGMSQEQLADVAGLKRTSITNIEAGRQGMDLERAALVARGLRIGIAELISPGDLDPLPLPAPPHTVTIRRVFQVTCETCGGTVIDIHTDRAMAVKSKHDHIAETREEAC